MAQDTVKRDKAIIEPGCKSLFTLGLAVAPQPAPLATVRFDGQALSVPVLGQDDQIHLEMMLWPDRGREFLRRLANAARVNLALRSGATLSLDTVGARPALEALALCETVHFGSRLISRAVSPSGTQNPMAR